MTDHANKMDAAVEICTSAGFLALDHFNDRASLSIDRKGPQDWVSEAGRAVEAFVREKLAARFPEDGLVGEEEAPVKGSSGFCWVIDPFDGTTNFINGIPAWTVVLAGVSGGRTVIGVIHDACAGETYTAHRGGGATLRQSTKPARENWQVAILATMTLSGMATGRVTSGETLKRARMAI